ncbi:MAG TPA: SDR family NAD(P)-dependent oxidoreductase [Aggregatilinea sp.]|uniref:SDR family NAD(P)-dependent oxidoreductase n=1 Tax=Aggregatilinea sp. TaxID=2806333 RepID=UPI002BA5D133|nr:SDR family NAD(P)-dependent oxidoreductase [Aggregatilinea sp.]HML20015.1 SDR family NAD(P)-dependent oxidoreductase [Aggregatilinea sp.]
MKRSHRLLWGGAVAGGLYWLARYFQPRHSPLVLDGEVVLITGASSGIGRALAFAFARRGARLVLVARTVEQLEAVRREVEPYTTAVLVIPTDLTDEAQMQHAVDLTLSTFGRIDVLVNNAGLLLAGKLQDQDPLAMQRVIDVDLRIPIRLTQLVLPSMLAAHHGTIINVGSGFSRTPTPLFTAYVAAKAGLAAFTDALRREVDGSGVQAMLVLPGWTHTDLLPPEAEDYLERQGFRIEHPDEVAERAILGLLRGEHEVIMGGAMEKLSVLAERYAPGLMRLYWRLRLTPEWTAVLSRVGNQGEGVD